MVPFARRNPILALREAPRRPTLRPVNISSRLRLYARRRRAGTFGARARAAKRLRPDEYRLIEEIPGGTLDDGTPLCGRRLYRRFPGETAPRAWAEECDIEPKPSFRHKLSWFHANGDAVPVSAGPVALSSVP